MAEESERDDYVPKEALRMKSSEGLAGPAVPVATRLQTTVW